MCGRDGKTLRFFIVTHSNEGIIVSINMTGYTGDHDGIGEEVKNTANDLLYSNLLCSTLLYSTLL